MRVLSFIAALLLAALATLAAESKDSAFASSTWVAGSGPRAQIWILKVRGKTFTGAVCGPCDDPRSMAPIVDGKVLDPHHIVFFILHDLQGGLFSQYGPYRNEARVTFSDQDTGVFESHVEGEAWTSHTVHQNWTLVSRKPEPK